MKRLVGTMTAVLSLTLLMRVQVRAQVPDDPLPSAPAAQIAYSNPLASNRPGPTVSARETSMPNADVSLYTIVDLALRNSKAVQIAEADRKRVFGAMLETRDAYIPNFLIGGGPGYSYGFPIGGPYLFQVTSNSLLFSFSQHDYTRSTNAAFKAATLSLKNTRQQVILDAALDYIELVKALGQVAALDEAVTDTDSMISIVEDRMRAGLESKVNVTRDQLTRAQIRLREIQMQDHADELRNHLAELTGLDPATILPDASSIPQLPDLDFHSLMRDGEKSPAVQAAFATAESRRFGAIGDKNQNYRPTVNMVFQYQRFSTFNGYQNYYLNFQQNNFIVGIQAIWPVFDPIRRDKTMESKAEAIRAQRQAELTRIQNDESNFALWHSLRELKEQERVAELQQELAQDTLAATITQMNRGAAAANAPPVTPQQAAQDRIEERTSYVDLRDAQFNVTRVKLNLLNAVGGLESWAKESADLGNGSISVTPQVLRH